MLNNYTSVMITGGAGFIGSHLCDEVLKQGKHIIVVDDLSTGRENNLPPEVNLIKVSICDYKTLLEAMMDVDIVFHVAAQPSIRASIEDPNLDFQSNIIGTYNVLMAAMNAGVSRVVYTSSSAVYGVPGKLPLSENEIPVPNTPYGASKLSGEHYCTAFNHIYYLPCVCLRPFNVYGTRENLETSLDEVVQYTRAIVEGRPITVQGDGSQTRDYVYVKDVAHAHMLAADTDDGIGKTFNVGTGVEISINDLVRTIEEVTGKKALIERESWPQGNIRREVGDITFARKTIGFAPETELFIGIRHVIKDLKVALV